MIRLWCRRPVAVLPTVVLVGALTGCAANSDGVHDADGSHKTAQEILDPMLDRVVETTDWAGGSWGYLNGRVWDKSNRNVDDFALFGCTADELDGPQRYTLTIKGPGAPDPLAAANEFSDTWRRRGLEVKQIGPAIHDGERHVEMVVVFPHRALLAYSVNTRISGIDAQSECSASPAVIKLSMGDP